MVKLLKQVHINGKIIETGTHQQLIEADGFYKTLWDAQSGHSLI